MKIFLIFALFCFGSSQVFASVQGVSFICASKDLDFKITALSGEDQPEKGRVARVFDEGVPTEYSEKVNRKRKHFFTINSEPNAKTLITIKDVRNVVIATLTTDPLTNHAVDVKSQNLDTPTHKDPDHKTVMKQTNLDAKLTTPGQEIMEQEVSCLITKYVD